MKLNLKKITRTVGLTLLLGLSSIGHAATTFSGKHDSASCSQITGWAWDSTQPTMPITVDIYDGSNKLTTLAADVFRQSLLDAGKGDGKHAFTFPTPASLRDGVAHSITIMIGGTQQKLTSSPKTITCGALYNIQSDHLGTPRVVVDQNNKVVWRNEGEPFGNGLPEQDVDADGKAFTLNLRFPGQYYDKETGRNQNHFRDYDAETGRYVQSDPIGLRGGVNTFVYVGGNPVTAYDPTGEFAWVIPAAEAIVEGGALAYRAYRVYKAAEAVVKATEACQSSDKNDKCGPDSRVQAELKAYAFAGIPLNGSGCDTVPWSDYNNKDSRGYAQARSQGARCMGYRSQRNRARVEDHPGGHNDNNAPHHDCPHFHATNEAGETAIFTYKL